MTKRRQTDNSGLSATEFVPWPLLRRVVSSIPRDICLTLPGKDYQTFEVLLTRLASIIEPEYEFYASPQQGDGGIDFVGMRTLFRLPKYELEQVSIIVGQCKARNDSATAKQIAKEFGGDPMDMVSTVNERWHVRPALMIFATSAKVTRDQRKQAKKRFEDALLAPAMFLSGEELEYLIARNLSSLRCVFDHCLELPARQQVVDYFERLQSTFTPAVDINVGSVGGSETGRPFTVPIEIRSETLREVRIRWRYSALRDREILREITPAGIARDEGIPLLLRHGRAAVALKLIGFSAGEHDLGKIEVLHGAREVNIAPLGSVELLEAYHPPFFREPYERNLREFESWLESAEKADRIHVVTVSGLGGVGKSRLCDELGFLVEQHGGRWLSLSHPHTGDDPYALLMQLLAALVPGPRRAHSAAERVLSYLRDVYPRLAERAEQVLVRRTDEASADPGAVFGDILTALLLNAASEQLLGIHLSDLHWSGSLLFNVVDDVLERLRSVRGDTTASVEFPIRLMLILEGRRMDARAGDAAVGVQWESFIDRRDAPGVDHQMTLRPFSREDSERFVEHVFASTDTSDTPVPAELIPHQKLLVETIQKQAEGTPLFITEYVRLLRAHRHLDLTRTGLVYLSRRIDGPIEVPATVDDIITRRFRYLESRHPDVALLVRAVAFIKDRVSGGLYEQLREELAPRASDSVVVASDFLRLPETIQESVRFRHESYYSRLQQIEISRVQRRQLAKVFLGWLETQPQSAIMLFERGLVLGQSLDATAAELEETFRAALHMPDVQPLLAMRILQRIVALYPPDVAELRELDPERLVSCLDDNVRLLRSATDACDFPLAHRQIATIRDASGGVLASRWPGDARLRTAVERCAAVAQMQLVNISLHQMRIDVSIRQADELLRALPGMSRGDDDEWWRIEAETRNRLGIALSWDRQHDRALAELARALELAKKHRDEPLTMFWTIDFGTALMHVDRQSGLAALNEVAAAARQRDPQPGSMWEDVLFLAETHLSAGQIAAIDVRAADANTVVAEMLDRMERVSTGANRNGWSYITGSSALIAGACAAVLQRWSQAASWWMKAVEIGMRDEHDEFLWKSHVNLAQLAADSAKHNAGAVELHAQEAERLIRADIDRRGSDNVRRRAFYAGPLLQIHRVWQRVHPERAERLSSEFPEIVGDWRAAAPLHVAASPSVFFVMN